MDDLDKAVQDYITLDICGDIEEEHSVFNPKVIPYKNYKKKKKMKPINKTKCGMFLDTTLDVAFIILKILGYSLGILLVIFYLLASTESE